MGTEASTADEPGMGLIAALKPYLRGWRRRFKRGPAVDVHEARLAQLIGTACKIPTQTSIRERLCLYEEAVDSLSIGRFVEIGSYLGATAVVLAEALRRHEGVRDGLVYCIDTWQNDAMSEGKRDTSLAFEENAKPWRSHIRQVKGDSKSLDAPFDGLCDLVFIDGDHTYEGASSDVRRFGGLVREGGRLVFHDHVYYHKTVARVVGELLCTGDWIVSRCVDNIISLSRCTTENTPRAFLENESGRPNVGQ